MRSIIALLLFLVAASMFCRQARPGAGRQVALPSPNLMKCDVAQLWVNESVIPGSAHPIQLTMDHFNEDGCPQGIVALYDKSISQDEIEASLDKLYGKWAKPENAGSPVKLWRVEPEKFAIELATIEDSSKKAGIEKGVKQVIYLSFSVSKR